MGLFEPVQVPEFRALSILGKCSQPREHFWTLIPLNAPNILEISFSHVGGLMQVQGQSLRKEQADPVLSSLGKHSLTSRPPGRHTFQGYRL